MYMVTIAARISSSSLVSEALEGERRALEAGLDARRQAESCFAALDRLHRVAERAPGARLNETVPPGTGRGG
jgi:hypothetical protein